MDIKGFLTRALDYSGERNWLQDVANFGHRGEASADVRLSIVLF